MNEKEKLLENIKLMLEAYENESAMLDVVTDEYESVEKFVRSSMLVGTEEGNPFYFDGKHVMMFFTEGKVIQATLQDGKIANFNYLIGSSKPQTNLLETMKKTIDKLIDLESSDTHADKKI